MHKRQAIRDEAFVRLGALAASHGVTVDKNRLRNWQVEHLPGIAVYTIPETSELYDIARRHLHRTLQVEVDVHVRTTGGDPADDLDELLVAVEGAMEAGDQGRLAGLAIRSHLSATTIGLSGEAEARHAAASLIYEVLYRTHTGDPEI